MVTSSSVRGISALLAAASVTLLCWFSRVVFVTAMLSSKTCLAQCPDIPLLRFEENPAATHAAGCDGVNPFAYVALEDSTQTYISFGGEIRERYEHANNRSFGADPDDPRGTWLQRFGLFADLHSGDHLRAFVEVHSALEYGRAGGPSPSDENKAELQNAFIEARRLFAPNADIQVRLGRQELQLGSGRLVSVRDGPNVRRSFDGVRVRLEAGVWSLDTIAMRPRKDEQGAFDDPTDRSRALWGAYATRSFAPQAASGLDLYYLGYRNDAATFDQGSAGEHRHTLGIRLFGSADPWRWNLEPMVQFGKYGDADLRAWTLASETSYTWSEQTWGPRLTLSANVASGDRNPLDPELQTFNPLYPRGNYFSEDATLWPLNFYNAHLFLTIHPTPAWALTADYNAFWRTSDDDGVYGPNGSLLRAGQGSDARFVATALSITSEWSLNRHVSVTAIYTHFSPREFLEQTGAAAAIDFIELTARLRF